MANIEKIPSLAGLALEYGTITRDQFLHLKAVKNLKNKENHPSDYASLLLSEKFATRYQVGLLTLIQEYHIIRKRGVEFGKIAVEKGFATKTDVQNALETQKKEFRRARLKKLIGDILVDAQVITAKQKQDILEEQTLLEQQANRIFYSQTTKDDKHSKNSDTDAEGTAAAPPHPVATDPELSAYEANFLRIKSLDKEFAAIVLEKGLASEGEVATAQNVQENEFKKNLTVKILGDIMVSMDFITPEQKDIVLEEQGRESQGETIPPFEIIITRDKMAARVKINKKSTSQISIEDIKQSLKDLGVTRGIYPDTLLQGQLNRIKTLDPDRESLEFQAAKSDNSSRLLTACQMIYHTETQVTSQGEKRKGDLLAEERPNWEWPVQKTLFGKNAREASPRDYTLRCGSGTRPSQSGNGITAAKTGKPFISIDRTLYIHPIIHVLEDADLRYGQLEPYANLSISGVLTGAYPVTAGRIKAREIRGAYIVATGDIISDVGITDSTIRTQGNVSARYLHNCRIEIFGDLHVKNEIYDSEIFCSGEINSPNCRVIASLVHAKKGICLGGAGSEKTQACTLSAGGEDHLIECEKKIKEDILGIRKQLNLLLEERDRENILSKNAFQKMVELKIFHDRAKQKKEILGKDFKKKKDQYQKEKLKNIILLISNFEKRMEKSIASLKELNLSKKKHDQKKNKLEKKIKLLTPRIKKETLSLEQTLDSFFEWSRSQKSITEIEIKGTAFQGTRLSGIYSSIVLESQMENFSVKETKPDNKYQMDIVPL